MFVVIVLCVHQYCRCIGLWSASQDVKASRSKHVTPPNRPVVEKFYYSPHSRRILLVSYSNTLWYTDLNDVLTVCGRCVLRLLRWHKLWVWTREDFQLIFTSYRTNKKRKPNKASAHKELTTSNGSFTIFNSIINLQQLMKDSLHHRAPLIARNSNKLQ
jgi:hypothetical protein